ncbi:MAG: helix-hairpin-helix domain-containing protein [Chitinophagaceae bacterium]|nr:helix-hairpin-helix domain-containing protein [Chitinophagaceae bacterium]
MPYVQIQHQQNNNFPTQNNYPEKTYDKLKYTPSVIDINSADTTAFIALPGIGSKLAQRITAFRDKLGGFYKIEQVAETFGLPDSTFQKIKPRLSVNSSAIKKYNINTATVDEMKTHPYIRYNIANAIIQYRNQHGNFSNVADVKKIMIIDETIFAKISPYLTTQ